MKKNYLIILAVFISCISTAGAQESMESFNPSWEYYMKDYDKQQFVKPITPQDYEQALKTVQEYKEKQTQKKKKKHWWSRSKAEEPTPVKKEDKKESEVPDTPPSPHALLRLPYDTVYNGVTVSNGFYLVSLIKNNNKIYMRFTQGNQIVADIETKVSAKPADSVTTNSATAEIPSNNKVKVIYTGKEGSYEVYLPLSPEIIIK